MTHPPFAREFTKLRVQINEPRPGFDMYIAVWKESPQSAEIVLGAPSVKALSERWQSITKLKLDEGRVQHVAVIYCAAPEELWRQAKAAAEEQGE